MTTPDPRIAQWIAMALLAPAWWGMGLMALAVFADLFPRQRERVSAVFDRLEHTRQDAASGVGGHMPTGEVSTGHEC